MRKIVSTLLSILTLFSVLSLAAFGDNSGVVLLNFGDSVAWGRIEDEEMYPDYDMDNDSYSALLASYFGTKRINYARGGLQTTDLMYMLDKQFKKDVDSKRISPDSWHTDTYPPFDGVPLKKIAKDISRADYITLCVGACDFASYPGEVRDVELEKTGDLNSCIEELKQCLQNGEVKIDIPLCSALLDLLDTGTKTATIYVRLIVDIIKGYADYMEYYPQIVKNMRDLNKDATIILVGDYVPDWDLTLFEDIENSGTALWVINRLFDNINLAAKKTAARYGCIYVDTMGVECKWHPTPYGHKQIFERIVGVLNGDRIYAGNAYAVDSITDKLFDMDKTASYLNSCCSGMIRVIDGFSDVFSVVIKCFRLFFSTAYFD